MSHCGFIFKIDDQYQVIHTISKSLSDIDGIRINTLERICAGGKTKIVFALSVIIKN